MYYNSSLAIPWTSYSFFLCRVRYCVVFCIVLLCALCSEKVYGDLNDANQTSTPIQPITASGHFSVLEKPLSIRNVTASGGTTTDTRSPTRNASGSFFPPDYSPIPDVDVRLPEPTDDLDETIYSSDIVMDDLMHQPIAFHFSTESYTGLRPSTYTSSCLVVMLEERQALLAERKRQRQSDSHQHASNNVSVNDASSFSFFPVMHSNLGPVQKSAAVPLDALSTEENTHPDEILEKLIDGHHIEQTFYPDLIPFTDRYFTHHQDLSSIKNEMCDTFIELMHIPDRPPLIVSMFNWMIARFALRCVYYRTNALLTAKRKFVLVASLGDNAASNAFFLDDVMLEKNFTLTYFIEHPLLLHWYGVNGNLQHRKFTPLPLGNKVFHRSGQSLQTFWFGEADAIYRHNGYTQHYLSGLNLSLLFPHIQHELRYGRRGTVWLERALELFAGRTIDPPVEWIPFDQLPERVTTIYIIDFKAEKERNKPRHSLTDEVLLIHNEPGNRAAAAAQHIALLPFPTAMYHKLKQQPYGSPDRVMKLLVGFSVWDWRRDLFAYLGQPHIQTFVQNVTTNLPEEFYPLLGKMAFVMSPVGFGYDCYRTWEALAFGAIPIVQDPVMFVGKLECLGGARALEYGAPVSPAAMLNVYDDLPVVKVKSDNEITLENLEKWRAEIYEKAKRGEYQLEKLFLQYWMDMVYNHTNEEPT